MQIKDHVTIEYTGKLPSVNHMYGRFQNRTYLKPEGKQLKDAIFYQNRARMPLDREIRYLLVVSGNWYNKKGLDLKKGE